MINKDIPNKSNINKGKTNKKKVWVKYVFGEMYPYRVIVEVGKKSDYLGYDTEFFAKRRAKKIAKILKIKPNLDIVFGKKNFEVWTQLYIISNKPYRVYWSTGNNEYNRRFMTKFWAEKKAKKLAEKFNVKPDLSFKADLD